jgi:hypothetical protein
LLSKSLMSSKAPLGASSEGSCSSVFRMGASIGDGWSAEVFQRSGRRTLEVSTNGVDIREDQCGRSVTVEVISGFVAEANRRQHKRLSTWICSKEESTTHKSPTRL